MLTRISKSDFGFFVEGSIEVELKGPESPLGDEVEISLS